MSVKKKYGIHFKTRNSNHKYPQLDDLDHLKELTRVDCPADVARALKVPYNSLMHVIREYYTAEEQDQVAWKRARHQNKLNTVKSTQEN